MNKKRLLGLILFACFITGCLFLSADYLTQSGSQKQSGQKQTFTTEEETTQDDSTKVAAAKENSTETTDHQENGKGKTKTGTAIPSSELEAQPWVSSDPESIGNIVKGSVADNSQKSDITDPSEEDTYSTSADPATEPNLILDCTKVDYLSYIPEMNYDEELETALNIENPSISIDAKAAVLFDADTKEVLYYKDPVEAIFPASTAKLLTSLVALDWCLEEEEVTLGDEIKMIASDSTRAYLSKGQVLTVRDLLEGMLLPSGNDAAYAVAVYVGRKSLQNPYIAKETALTEFVRLMNLKATKLGAKNSCFKTPDGYDAIGQYTTAYDMGLIGVAAAKNEIIIDVTNQSRAYNSFISGEEVSWTNTNKLITRYSGQYYSAAIGLKTGTSTMAGRCLIAAAKADGRTVVCAIMDSTSAGRWEDAIALLKYGLE